MVPLDAKRELPLMTILVSIKKVEHQTAPPPQEKQPIPCMAKTDVMEMLDKTPGDSEEDPRVHKLGIKEDTTIRYQWLQLKRAPFQLALLMILGEMIRRVDVKRRQLLLILHRDNLFQLAIPTHPMVWTAAKKALPLRIWHRKALFQLALLIQLMVMGLLLMAAKKTPLPLMTGVHQAMLRRTDSQTVSLKKDKFLTHYTVETVAEVVEPAPIPGDSTDSFKNNHDLHAIPTHLMVLMVAKKALPLPLCENEDRVRYNI